MTALTTFLVTTFPPLAFVLAVPVAGFLGYLLGLYGLTRAENRAFSRLVAAQQRSRLAVGERQASQGGQHG